MPFTATELSNIASAQLSFYIKGPALAQTIQERPTYDRFKRSQKTFSGGDGYIKRNVKGEWTTAFTGFEHDDPVAYANPANIKQVKYAWKQMHGGIQITLDELKRDGITITDSMRNGGTSTHSEAEMHRITSLLEDKLSDMGEGLARSFTSTLWADGTTDPKVFPGITAFIVDTPTTGVVAGLDRAAVTWWRNRSLVGASVITSSTSLQTLTKTLRKEVRALRRYGGRPNYLPCGSRFLELLEAEVFEKGIYTQQGFVNNGKTDVGSPSISMKGVGDFIYDPSLDDMGYSDRCYFLDMSKIRLMPMEGEDMKEHNPARPHDRYVIYKAVTWTGALVVDQMNAHGVYQAA